MIKKVLVCDDDSGISEVIKIMLETSGYEVSLMANGKGIQKAVKEKKPNLIFLDLWLPGIDGKEVTKLLKKDPLTKKVPIIIISALSDIQKIALQTGADDFLPKPFDMQDLLNIAHKYA